MSVIGQPRFLWRGIVVAVLLLSCGVSQRHNILHPDSIARKNDTVAATIVQQCADASQRLSPTCGTRQERATFLRATLDHLAATRAEREVRSAPSQVSSLSAWTFVGPRGFAFDRYSCAGVSSGRITALAADPTNVSVIYAGSPGGGVWKSGDGGTHWTPPSPSETLPTIGALAIDPKNDKSIYAGTADADYSLYGQALIHSSDGGATWTNVGGSALLAAAGWEFNVSKIVLDPHDSQTIWLVTDQGYFITGDPAPLLVTHDGGTTWSAVHIARSTSSAVQAQDLVFDPSDPHRLFAAMGGCCFPSDVAGLYLSTDGGATWHLLSSFPNAASGSPVGRIQLAIAQAASGSVYYASVEDVKTFVMSGFYSSVDGGQTWTANTVPDIQAHQNWLWDLVSVDPNDPSGKTVWVTGFDAFKSTDGGKTWANTTNDYACGSKRSSVHTDQRAIVAASGVVYLGNDGGVWSTADEGQTWTERNDTLAVTQMVSVAASDMGQAVVAGAIDNGTVALTGEDPASARSIFGGDGGDTAIDRSSPQTIYAETQYGNDVGKSRDGGEHWSSILTGITGTGSATACFRAPLRMENQNPQHLFFATNHVFETTDGGATWSSRSPDLTGGQGCISGLDTASSNPQVWYAATDSPGNSAWITRDAGATWTNISGGLPHIGPIAVAVSSADPQVAYVTFATCWSVVSWGTSGGPGCSTNHPPAAPLWRTQDGGAHWQSLSANFPTVSASAVLVDPRNPDHLFVGTDLGVFQSPDGGATWSAFMAGMPPTPVSALRLSPGGTQLYAATLGRGVFELDLVPRPTATPTPIPTATAMPTATPTVVPLFVKLKLAHRSIKVGQKQSITVSTVPNAGIALTIRFPTGAKKSAGGTADTSGTFVYRIQQPRMNATSKPRRVKITVKVSRSNGQVATASISYLVL